MPTLRWPRAAQRVWVPVVYDLVALDSSEALGAAIQWVPPLLRNVAFSAIDTNSPAACLIAREIVLAGGTIPDRHPWTLASSADELLVVLAQLGPGNFAVGAGLLGHARADEADAEAVVAELQRRIGGEWLLIRHPGLIAHGGMR